MQQSHRTEYSLYIYFRRRKSDIEGRTNRKDRREERERTYLQISFSNVVYSFGNVNIIPNCAEIVVSFIVTANAFLYDSNEREMQNEFTENNKMGMIERESICYLNEISNTSIDSQRSIIVGIIVVGRIVVGLGGNSTRTNGR